MDQRAEQTPHNFEPHWIALAGVIAASLIAGGLGKPLTPQGLYKAPQAAQLIAAPPIYEAEGFQPAYPNGPPEYAAGLDLNEPPRQAISATDASHARTPDETVDIYSNAAEAVSTAAVTHANDRQAFSAEQAASSDSAESYPAMAPG